MLISHHTQFPGISELSSFRNEASCEIICSTEHSNVCCFLFCRAKVQASGFSIAGHVLSSRDYSSHVCAAALDNCMLHRHVLAEGEIHVSWLFAAVIYCWLDKATAGTTLLRFPQCSPLTVLLININEKSFLKCICTGCLRDMEQHWDKLILTIWKRKDQTRGRGEGESGEGPGCRCPNFIHLFQLLSGRWYLFTGQLGICGFTSSHIIIIIVIINIKRKSLRVADCQQRGGPPLEYI